MAIDGVNYSRVHLAIPESSIFRTQQGRPTAAVSVEMQPDIPLSGKSIEGIRQLVASSVPGLSTVDVVVLDKKGNLVRDSGRHVGIEPTSERDALEKLLVIRARNAISGVLPTQPFEVLVSVYAPVEPEMNTAANSVSTGIGLDHRPRRILVRTPQILGSEEREAIRAALVGQFGYLESEGDILTFTHGALAQSQLEPPASRQSEERDATFVAPEKLEQDPLPAWLFSRWTLIGLIILSIGALAVWPRRRLPPGEVDDFADLIRTTSSEWEAAKGG